MIRIPKSTLVSVPLIAGQATYKFGNQSILEGKKLKHFLLVTAGKDRNGLAAANPSALILFRDTQNFQVIENLPTSLLKADVLNPVEFGVSNISWNSSEVTVTDVAAIQANTCLMFLAIYE